MDERVGLPEGLAEMPAGPDLAAALAAIDPDQLNGHELVALAPVYQKLISNYQAGLLTVLHQIEHTPPGDAESRVERTVHPDLWAQVEIAAALLWSPAKASYELRYADHLNRRLPMVHAALAAGVLDISRARAFVDYLAFLDEEPARQIATGMLAAGAGSWSRRQLVARLRRACIAHDPQTASKRQRQRQSERFVQTDEHPDGTTDLYGRNLPPERVAEIMERLGAIARTTKRHGDGRTTDQLMADVFCDLLAGTGVGATPAATVTDPALDPDLDPDPHPDPDTDTPSAAVPLPGPRRGVVELQAPLSTLLGLSEAPGDLGGWRPVIADIVRQLTAQMGDAQWRFSIYGDDTRQLVAHGITHARPCLRPADGFAAADVAFIRARDRTCRGSHGCAVPASACDTDHTLAKVDGGGHDWDDGGPLCRRDHRFKHEAGAQLTQPEPGVFRWITPRGHEYTTRPEPYDESTGPPQAH